jgi:hypothetical protein
VLAGRGVSVVSVVLAGRVMFVRCECCVLTGSGVSVVSVVCWQVEVCLL